MKEKYLELLNWLKINGHLYSDVANIDYLLNSFEESKRTDKNTGIIKTRQEIDQMIYDLESAKYGLKDNSFIDLETSQEIIDCQIEVLKYRYTIDQINEQSWNDYVKMNTILIYEWMCGKIEDENVLFFVKI